MKKYHLIISQNNQTQQVLTLNTKKPLKLKTKANIQYKIYDEDGKVIHDAYLKIVGDDAYVYLPNQTEVALVLENYQNYTVISDIAELTNLNTTLATTTPLASGAGISAIATGLGVVALGTEALKKDYRSPILKPTQPKQQTTHTKTETDELTKNPPKITFNNITEDNIINLSESQATLAVTGTVANSKAGDVLTVTIGTASQTVTITDGKFSLNLDGKTLIVHNEIGATLSRNGKDISTTAHSYQVDTEIEKPTINFNNIAGDDVINLKESEGKVTVSGTVENAKDGDEITLSCGCPSCTGVEWVDIKTTIQNGTFSVDFNGSDMVANGRTVMKASVTTSDDAKNTATGTAQQSYDVDISPPEPSFVYDELGNKGVINREIAQNHIVLKGKIANLGDNETISVKVIVNNKEYPASKVGDYYQVAVASGELANGQAVQWHLTARDKAGNEKIIEQNQSYIYDVTLNQPTVAIATNNQTVNNQSKGLTLSGSLNFDADVVKSSVKVAILLNNQTYSANVNTDNKTWTFSLPENIAKSVQGDNAFTVKISVADNAGNVAENQSVGNFIVDTIAPQVQITLNPIGEIAQTGAEKVALSGTISGEFKPTDKVKVSVNGTEFVANIAQNSTFSVEVPRTTLIQNASQKISASLESTDTAGNIGTATAEQNYTVGTVVTPPNTPKPISIQLDSLTSDDLINVTESKQATSKISGTASNADGQTIAVKIGENTHNAVVQNGKFSLNINTQDLIQNASGKIVATVGGQTIERAYTVDDFATSQLQITEIGEHFQVFAPNDTVQFTGKVDLSGGILGKWNNASLINSIQATLNGKTYQVGLNADKTFTLNIPVADLKQAEGQGFTFSLPENRFSVYDLKMGRYSDSPMDYTAEYARLDDQSKYQLDANPLLNNGKIVAPQTDFTTIAGVVMGKANVGDTVVVQVGEHRHETQVEQGDKGLIFRVNVPTEQLLGVANETVSATLSGRDWQNKDYEISVLAKYEIGNADSHFAVTHPLASTTDIATEPKAPYFIQAMSFSLTQGHLQKHPVGQEQTAELTYRFKPTSGSETTFNESNREVTRKGLKMLEKYANITFTEVGDNEKADIGYIMTDGGSANGFADYGGDVWLNGAKYQNGGLELKGRLGYMTMIHETLHSLGAKHPFEGRATFPSEENDKMVSFMNYNNRFTDAKLELPMYDLMYLQYRYGVNKTARTENNTYKFNAFNPNVVDGDIYVWDGAGVDTFDASDQKQGVTVDLTPGSWIHSGAKSQNFLVESVKNWNAQTFFNNQSAGRNLSEVYIDDKTPTYTTGQAFIGYGTQIERLIGSDFADSLKGNIANNDIYGNDGNDTIFGDAGNDYLDGGKGADELSGGLGDDIFVVDNVGDKVFENQDEGMDTVYAHMDYTLAENVENLTLFGTASKGVGNALDNRIVGNGQANTLTGGAGKDTFVFNDVLDGNVDTITDFTVGEDKIELNPLAFVGLTAENLAQRIQYDSKTGHLTYDPDGSDKADVIHFATLANKPNLTVDGNHFVLSGATSSTTNTPTTPVTPKPSAHILYVSDEQKENHFATFEQALAQAKTGSTIVLMKSDTVLGNYTQDNNGRVNALSLPEITIDGQGHTLKIAVRPLSLLGDTTFKNMTLALQPLVSLNGAFASLGSGGATEGEQFIFLNGHKATFDQVSTQIDGQHPRTRPTIIMGAEKNQTDAGHAELVVLNADKTGGQTQFKNIIAGSSESDKTTDSLLNLGRGTVVLDQVIMGGTENHRMTGAVKVQNASSAVQNFNGENVANDEVILNNVDYLNAPTLNQINDLTLSGTSGFTTPHLNIGGMLTLGENSRLTVSAGLFSDDDASLVVGGLHSDNATLNLGDTATMDLNGNIKGTLTVKTSEQDVIRTDNSNAHIKQIEEGYLLGDKPFGDTSVQPTRVHLDVITSDDVINVTESKLATTKITGTAENADGQMVAVQIGNDTHAVKVKNGKFSLDVDTQILLQNQGGKVSARIGEQVSERAYTVDNFASTQIRINEMTDIAPSEMVRLTGKIKLEGLSAEYNNPLQFQSFVAKLNGKDYAVAINTNNQTFSWDISLADLQNAKGQDITFETKGGWSIYFVENGKARYQTLPQLDKSAYEFDHNAYIDNSTVKTDLPTQQTLIKGEVSGSAKVGDVVEVQVGTETLRTKVQDDLSFVVSVENTTLKQAEKITATLSGTNAQNKPISVQTEYAYDTGIKPSDKFVTPFVMPSKEEKPYFIKGLEFGDQQAGYLKNIAFGTGATITYSFNKEYYRAEDWTERNRKAVRDALDVYEKYADIKFTQLPDNSGVDVPNGVGRADIEFHHRPLDGAAGRAEFGGNVNINITHQNMDFRSGFFVLMHEIGHSLGMKHTHDNPNPFSYFEDHTGTSVMAYNGTNMDVNRWDLRMYDIAFIHYRYGVNKKARTGDDVYTFKTFNTQSPDGDIYIWDGAGVDTFDASKENERVVVDLTAGSWIYRGEQAERLAIKNFNDFYTDTYFTGYDGTITDDWKIINGKVGKYEFSEGQAFIGYGTQIERLIGSEHSDGLKGNVADNEIFGGAGDDLIDGRDGNDYLDGGRGNDTIHGGKGDDIFVVDNANDVVVENYFEGTDTVHSYAQSYTLSANVENISLFGNAQTAIGNDLNNRIVGNELSNTLTGGGGRDTFVFSNVLNGSVDTITDFNVNEDTIALALSVFDNLTAQNVKQHIKYDSQTGALSYDKDGSGTGDAVHFATLQNKPNLTIEEINIILI